MNLTWSPTIDGDDLVVVGTASWFGGANDPDDNGETASGLSTKESPEILGCALPFPGVRSTEGSPIPKMPYKTTMVQVTWGRNQITIPVIDLGPSLYTDRPIDLTQATFSALGGDLKDGLMHAVNIRILGGAKYVQVA